MYNRHHAITAVCTCAHSRRRDGVLPCGPFYCGRNARPTPCPTGTLNTRISLWTPRSRAPGWARPCAFALTWSTATSSPCRASCRGRPRAARWCCCWPPRGQPPPPPQTIPPATRTRCGRTRSTGARNLGVSTRNLNRRRPYRSVSPSWWSSCWPRRCRCSRPSSGRCCAVRSATPSPECPVARRPTRHWTWIYEHRTIGVKVHLHATPPDWSRHSTGQNQKHYFLYIRNGISRSPEETPFYSWSATSKICFNTMHKFNSTDIGYLCMIYLRILVFSNIYLY